MFTICPKCALTLVVTAADLRVAQGYVRCGRCSSVFNALARLSEERHGQATGAESEAPVAAHSPSAAAPTAAATPAVRVSSAPRAPAAAPAAAADEDAIPEDALEFNPAAIDVASVFIVQAPDPQWAAATGSFKAMQVPEPPAPQQQVEVELDAALLASVLQPKTPDPEPTVRAPETRAAPESAPRPAPRAPPTEAAAEPEGARSARAARHATLHARPATGAAPKPSAAAAPRHAHESRGDEDEAVRRAHAQRLRERRREADADSESSVARYAWGFGAALALLGLLAQIAHHYRDELAAMPRLNRPLSALYAALGVPLAPRWDLRAYDVRQLGASAEPGAGLITVRASVKNGAPQPQPLPLLRVTLQDRFGNRIAARDVAPRFYLPRATRPLAFLSAGERIDAEMGFVDPGANAVGFEIDACLPLNGGVVTCAADAGPPPQ